MRRLLLIILVLFATDRLHAQSYNNEVDISVTELLQYQRTKAKYKDANAPFRRYGFKRIRANRVLGDTDNVRLWGYHVSANLEFDKDKHPLYSLFKRNDLGSMAIIDCVDGNSSKCRVVFWNKKYYRRFSTGLRGMGFTMRNSLKQPNLLEFRRDGTTVGVDITIWGDIYLLDVVTLVK